MVRIAITMASDGTSYQRSMSCQLDFDGDSILRQIRLGITAEAFGWSAVPQRGVLSVAAEGLPVASAGLDLGDDAQGVRASGRLLAKLWRCGFTAPPTPPCLAWNMAQCKKSGRIAVAMFSQTVDRNYRGITRPPTPQNRGTTFFLHFRR